MFNWNHWRVTIDRVATEFELTDEELAALGSYVGVPATAFQQAVGRWAEAATAQTPRGWSLDEDTAAIEMWSQSQDAPGVLISTLVFTDSVKDFDGWVYDLSGLTKSGAKGVLVQLEPFFPELEKQSSVIDESRAISGFLDGLPEGIGLANLDFERSMHYVVADPISSGNDLEKVLADYFEIDLKQIEVERRKLIEYISPTNENR